SCLPHQLSKQRRCKSVVWHPLGMPLHAEHPPGPACPFQRFDDAVGRASGYTQAAPRLAHRLVMRAVYARARAPRQLSELAALDSNTMKRFGAPGAPIVVHGVW